MRLIDQPMLARLGHVVRRTLAYIRVGPQDAFRPNRRLSEAKFNKLAVKLIDTATDGTIPDDAIRATAKALGVLVSFTARRDGCSKEELLNLSLRAVANFSSAADDYIDANPATDPRVYRSYAARAGPRADEVIE